MADVAVKTFPRVTAKQAEVLQINLGRKCNLSCRHCHVEGGPTRTEVMEKDVLEACLAAIRKSPTINTIDITGGAPELNHHLAWFIKEAAKLNKRLIVRSNLVILLDKKYSHLIDVFVENKVEIVASLPCYLEENVAQQRGSKVYAQSIQVLKKLNQKGYGNGRSGLILDLVYNPIGANLTGPQAELENDYKKYLKDNFNIVFDHLFCMTNMPIGRFLSDLKQSGKAKDYMEQLVRAFNPNAVQNVMCRSNVSVGWDGQLYDCDFNQAMDLPIGRIGDFDAQKLAQREIIVSDYCYGCTAGSGSSCQGALE